MNKTAGRKLSNRYLERCKRAALSADPLKADPVIKDLRKIIHKLVNHIKNIQSNG